MMIRNKIRNRNKIRYINMMMCRKKNLNWKHMRGGYKGSHKG